MANRECYLILLCGLSTIFQTTSTQTAIQTLCSPSKTNQTCMCKFNINLITRIPVYYADCSRLRMGALPLETQLDNVEELNFSHNLISKLDEYKSKFASITLHKLSLAYNKIYYISPSYFDKIPNLKELDLSFNEMATFTNANTFFGLKKLTVLNLNSNQLTTLPEGLFSTLPNLKELDLGYNYLGELLMFNKNIFDSSLGLTTTIESLKLDNLRITQTGHVFFDGAHNLTHLSMAENPLKEVPTIPYNVEFLDLSGSDIHTLSARHLNYHSLKVLKLDRLSKLETIDRYAFYNLQSLEDLSLNDCDKLREFDSLAFGVIVKHMDWPLKRISFARSGLKTLNSSYLHLFDKLEHVDLQNNPWTCDCDLLWMRELSGSLYKEDNIRCISPFKLKTKRVMNLTEKDLPTCENTNSRYQKIIITNLICLIAVLIILIIYLIYLNPFNHTKYSDVGPDSPYTGSTVNIDPNRAETLD